MKPIQELIIALIKDTLQFLSKNPSFFDKTTEERKIDLKNLKINIPREIIAYLLNINETVFLKETTELVKLLNGKQENELKETTFAYALIHYLTSEFASVLDKGSYETSDQGFFTKTINYLLETYSYEETIYAIYEFIKSFRENPYLAIQSPMRLHPDLRLNIRQHLQKEFPNSFPIFMVNRDLIGGLRIFLDGRVHDYSWLNKINQLTSFRT